MQFRFFGASDRGGFVRQRGGRSLCKQRSSGKGVNHNREHSRNCAQFSHLLIKRGLRPHMAPVMTILKPALYCRFVPFYPFRMASPRRSFAPFLTELRDLQPLVRLKFRSLIFRLSDWLCACKLPMSGSIGITESPLVFVRCPAQRRRASGNRSWHMPISWHAADVSARWPGPAAHKSVRLSTRTGPTDVIWTDLSAAQMRANQHQSKARADEETEAPR